MEQPACRTLAVEFLPQQCCIVVYQGTEQPSDAAWDMYIDQIRALGSVQPELKVFVLTEGGRPNKEQQTRLAAVAGGRAWHTAVVSPAIAVRFVVSSIAPIKPNQRYFTPDQLSEALEHPGLLPADTQSIEQTIDRLRKHVHAPH